jgi:hypothetical protein
MSEKKSSTTKPGRKGGIMIHLTPELEKWAERRAEEMRQAVPGIEIGPKEAILNALHEAAAGNAPR